MIVGILKEIKNNDFRVALVPAGVRASVKGSRLPSNLELPM